jgi:O-antigen/teichoic acid export membrane protein
MFAAYVRFFQHGAAGARGSLGFARRLLPIGVALGIATGIALAIVAPALPSIIGHAYAGTERIVWILAILPFLYAFYYIGADTLVSSGHIGTRTTIQLVVLALQVALCFWLAPRFGAIGVACASVAVHVVLAALSWIAAIRYAKRA